jgi:hypothetical protein
MVDGMYMRLIGGAATTKRCPKANVILSPARGTRWIAQLKRLLNAMSTTALYFCRQNRNMLVKINRNSSVRETTTKERESTW